MKVLIGTFNKEKVFHRHSIDVKTEEPYNFISPFLGLGAAAD